MSNIEKTVGSFRSAIQDLLVPELKAIRTELEYHREEFQKIDQRFLSFQQELKDLREDMKEFREEMNRRFEESQKENNRRFEAVIQSIHNLEKTQERILVRLDVKEQVADLETRFSRFEYFIQQWKSNVMEKKSQSNLETVES
jgi:septal ring factor EnvC (AmiA/AmiB activator)